MIQTIYIEQQLLGSERAEAIIKKYSRARVIECEHYGEVFNRKGQNFRIQKSGPSLILAKKSGRKIYPTPEDHVIGAEHNYYFAHLLNCPFDCRYCFLQGKFDSANYVLFSNYEDFWEEIEAKLEKHTKPVHIFSGYDCDSLAFEPVTGFVTWLLEKISDSRTLHPNSNHLIELRTKSAQIRQLLKFQPTKHCLVAYSLAPQTVVEHFEHGTAKLNERLAALAKLQNLGWQVGLRIDPLIDFQGSDIIYREFYRQIENALDLSDVHSLTLGTMRFPATYLNKIRRFYPDEALFAGMHRHVDGSFGYHKETTHTLIASAMDFFTRYIDSSKIFVHHSDLQTTSGE